MDNIKSIISFVYIYGFVFIYAFNSGLIKLRSSPDDDSQSGFQNFFRRRERPLPIDGYWSTWNTWSTCYNNTVDLENFFPLWENFFVQRRHRTCTNPKPSHGGVECPPPSQRYKQCSCMNPLLGISNIRLKETKVTSSNYLTGYPPEQARISQNFSGWCSESKLSYLKKTYMQVDFGKFANVGGIVTYGIKNGRIKQYRLEYSLNGKHWETIYQNKEKTRSKFKGNIVPRKRSRNIFPSHLLMKYIRLIPTSSFGNPCLKIELYGCSFTCGHLLMSSHGEIIARSLKEIDQNCLWRVEVLNTTSLTFNFNVFYVLCEHGYLDFHAGDVPFNESLMLKRVCLDDSDVEDVPSLKLNHNTVWLNFVSNSSEVEVGFNIRYSSECSQVISLVVDKQIKIKSPNFPNNYFNNLDCLWTITPPKHLKQMKLTVDTFSIESSINATTLCSDDVVIIETVKDGLTKVIGAYCNNNEPSTELILNADKVLVSFKTDFVSSDKGFSFSLLSGIKPTPSVKTTERKSTTKGKSHIYTTLDSLSNPSNNSLQITHTSQISHKRVQNNEDDGWTVIIISAFSALVFFLLVVIGTMNIRRIINNRNEISARCAKLVAEEKKEKSRKLAKLNKEYLNKNIQQELLEKQISPAKVRYNLPETDRLLETPCNEDEHTDELPESPTNSLRVCVGSTNAADVIELHNSVNDVTNSVDELDGDCSSYDSSSLQVHSPLKTMAIDAALSNAEESVA